MLKTTMMVASAAALLLPMAAAAQGNDTDLTITGDRDMRSETVSISDLNLRSDRAVRVADSRLRRAAANVCDYSGGDMMRRDYRDCYQDAFSRARVDLNSVIAEVRAS